MVIVVTLMVCVVHVVFDNGNSCDVDGVRCPCCDCKVELCYL